LALGGNAILSFHINEIVLNYNAQKNEVTFRFTFSRSFYTYILTTFFLDLATDTLLHENLNNLQIGNCVFLVSEQ